jgi:nucleoside 2-deoxyribosyltransferase
MKKSVYLCGPITGLSYEEATAEREKLVERFADYGIEAKSPMRGKIFLLNERELKPGGYTNPMSTDRAIVGRDRFDVRNSTCILADLRGAKKVSIGSMVEFGWADAYGVPIITVMEKDNPIHNHAFVHQLSTYMVDDMDDAVHLTLMLLNAR